MMAAAFWDRKGVLMMEFVKQGIAVNVRSVLRSTRNLLRAIQDEMHGMLTFGAVLLHENGRLHTTAHTGAFQLGV
jgi:hypothetical protein